MAWPAASDLADWWDENHRRSRVALEHMVDANPGLFAVVVATTVQTSTDLGSGFVDVLRFGEGAAAGGPGGYGQDVLRLASIGGGRPIAAGLKTLGRSANVLLATRVTNLAPKAHICGYVAIAQALRLSGNRLFVSAKDLLAASGFRGGTYPAGATMTQLARLAQSYGARVVWIARSGGTRAQVLEAARRGGAVGFGVHWVKRATGTPVGHALTAFMEGGTLRILDRTGKVVSTLSELESSYSGISKARIGAIIHMPEHAVNLVNGVHVLLAEVRVVVLGSQKKADELLDRHR